MDKLPFNPLLRWIENRIKKNQNVIIILNGATGSGKTYSAMSLCHQVAQMMGTNFNIRDNMDFNFVGLLKKTMLEKNKKPGTPFLFEEVGSVGSGSASRTWQSQANSFFFSFMQTTRHRNQVLFMTCPNFSFLERGARSLVHMQCETSHIDYSKKLAYLKCYRVQINNRDGKFYFKYLRVRYKNHLSKVKLIEVPMPPEDMCKDYEVLKTKFTSDLNKKIIDDSQPRSTNIKKVDPDVLNELVKKGFSIKQLAKKFGVCVATIKNYKRELKKEQQKQASSG